MDLPPTVVLVASSEIVGDYGAEWSDPRRSLDRYRSTAVGKVAWIGTIVVENRLTFDFRVGPGVGFGLVPELP